MLTIFFKDQARAQARACQACAWQAHAWARAQACAQARAKARAWARAPEQAPRPLMTDWNELVYKLWLCLLSFFYCL